MFPMSDQAGRPRNELTTRLISELADRGIASELRIVPYEFRRGAHTMLVVEGRRADTVS